MLGMGRPGGLLMAGARSPWALRHDYTKMAKLPSAVTYSGGANGTYFDSAGVLQTSGADEARFTHDPVTLEPLGLLIEEERENGIRNNTMVGAVAGVVGSGGQVPDNWTVNGAGTTVTISGLTTENGIDYVNIRFNGTPSTEMIAAFDSTTGIDALTGETWDASSYVSIVAGDLTNISDVHFNVKERTEAGAFVKSNVGSDFSGNLTSTLSRQDQVVTLSGGGTVAHIRPQISSTWDGSGDVDITLRIGLPQMEEGAFATSVIKTTTAAVTRTADLPTMSDVSWLNQSAGTFLVKGRQETLTGAAAVLIQIDDGGSTDRLIVSVSMAGTASLNTINSGGINGESISGSSISAATSFKIIGAYAQDDVIVGLDGTLDASPDTTADLPPTDTLTTARIGDSSTGSMPWNGTIASITYWPERLSNARLQELTA